MTYVVRPCCLLVCLSCLDDAIVSRLKRTVFLLLVVESGARLIDKEAENRELEKKSGV